MARGQSSFSVFMSITGQAVPLQLVCLHVAQMLDSSDLQFPSKEKVFLEVTAFKNMQMPDTRDTARIRV